MIKTILLVQTNPNSLLSEFKVELKLVWQTHNSNFNEILAERLNGLMNIEQFSIIYHQIISEYIDDILSNVL